MILNPTKALLSLSFPPSLYCKKSLSVWLRGQKFNISPSLGPFLCLTSFTTARETFFPLLTTTSLLLSLRHSKLLSSLFRQPLCLLICSLRCCFAAALRRGSPKCLSSFFSWSELLWSEDWPHFSRADFLDVQQLNVVEERLRRQRSEMRCNFLQLNYSGC